MRIYLILLGLFCFLERLAGSGIAFFAESGYFVEICASVHESFKTLLLHDLLVIVFFLVCSLYDVFELFEHWVVLDGVEEEDPEGFGLLEAPITRCRIDAKIEIAPCHFFKNYVA